jgi:stress-induced morphogen
MIDLSVLTKRIETLAPGTEVKVYDYTGTGDHFEAQIVSPAFVGKDRMDRHRMVMTLLDQEMKSGEIHALTMKTWTPEESKKFLIKK